MNLNTFTRKITYVAAQSQGHTILGPKTTQWINNYLCKPGVNWLKISRQNEADIGTPALI